MALSPGVGAPDAAAAAAAKAAKYGECPPGGQDQGSGQPWPLHGPWRPSSYKAGWTWPLSIWGTGPRQASPSCLLASAHSGHSAWETLSSALHLLTQQRVGTLWSICLLPLYPQGQPELLRQLPGCPVERSDSALELDRALPKHRSKPLELCRGSLTSLPFSRMTWIHADAMPAHLGSCTQDLPLP